MANYATLKAAINAVIRANGNKEITGTVLNETLTAMVNSLGANYQFVGVATPSTNPGTPDQNVFWLAGQAGTYTNFNNIVLPNGVSVLKWNGSWSSETVAVGDGVFDISVYKATGGTLATFADLSAALDGGNNIPSALRKGGMSVKFVQSSDNKYVQARCMAQNFTTDVTQWQGVDNSLIAGSQNLAKSGDVYLSSNYIIDSLDDANFETPIFQTSNTRILYVFKTIERDIVINADNLPQGYNIAARFALTRNNVIQNTSIILDITWQTKLEDILVSYRKGLWGAIVFRKTDNSALSDNDITIIKSSTTLFITSTDARIVSLNAQVELLNDYASKTNIVSFTGKGNDFSYVNPKNIIPKNRYRLYLQNTEWDISAVTVTGVYKFGIIARNNGTETVLANVQMNGTVKSYYDFIAPAAFDEIRIGGRANTGVDVPFELINLTTLEEKCDLVPYFSGMNHPVFSEIDLSVPTLKIKFLTSGYFRLYTAWGRSLIGDYSGAGNQTFTLTNLKSLVWDFNDSSVKIVDTSATGNYVHLLNLTRDSVTGLLVGWFNEHMRKETLSGIDGKINTLGEEISASKDYAIATGMAGFSASVDVGIPYKRKIIFRIDDPDGTITKMSDLAGYDYDGNNVVLITGVYLLPNTDYVVYAPCGIKSIRCWIGASFMTGTAGTITVQVTVPSQYAGDDIVKMWGSDDKLLIRSNLAANADFKALFFSDIHGSIARFERILQLGNGWEDILNCIIDGGDDTGEYKSQGNLDWYNTRALTSEKPIVRAAGNHDAWTTNYGVWATNQELYEYFTAVAVAQLTVKGATVVQPSDAAIAYKNYYYVDFGSLRIIVITSFNAGGYYDTDQATWFASVLSDAVTNDKSVICLNHAPMPLISAVENVECNWCSYKTRVSDGTIMEQDPLDKVDAFIRAGGKFVCWFTGHTHIDFVMKYSKTVGDITKTQFAFTTSTAKGGTNDGAQPTGDKRNPAYDLFNMVSVDLTNHLLKIWRIGFNTNAYLQVHNTFVWDFVNDKLVSES